VCRDALMSRRTGRPRATSPEPGWGRFAAAARTGELLRDARTGLAKCGHIRWQLKDFGGGWIVAPALPAIQPFHNLLDFFQVLAHLVWWQFADADAILGCEDEILAVTQYRNDRYAQRIEKMHQFVETLGVFPGAVCDDRKLAIAAIDFCDQEQIRNATRGRMNIYG